MFKILMIEDQQEVRNLLNKLLSRKGYEVVLAESGQEGLELLR